MNSWTRWKTHLDDNRSVWVDLLRVFLGLALFLRGVHYATNSQALLMEMEGTALYGLGGLAHLVILAHLAGGLLLAFGLVTRVACAILFPIMVGAVIAEQQTGLFAGGGLELAIFVFFALVVVFLVGPGPLSLDARLANTWRRKIGAAWRSSDEAHAVS